MDLGSYLKRIQYNGPLAPTIAVLRDIQLAHTCSIPFENLDVLLGRGISIDDDAIEQKLVQHHRGGYCFEQNSLLMRALTEIGYSVSPLSARVRVKISRDVITPRTHLFLRVEIDGVPWLVDVGVGGLSPTAPFELNLLDTEQLTPHEPRRVVSVPQSPSPLYFHQAKLVDQWVDVHEFTLQEMPLIDREIGNYWTSTHPKSKFRQNLMVGLACRDGSRLSILNSEFTHRRGAEILQQLTIDTPEQLLRLLDQRFGLRFPAGTRFGPPGMAWPT
jgi:N-hydroxyarylamine O-acetyltransferase